MSVALQAKAEIEKLARVLRRSPDELADLQACSPQDIRALRHDVADALHDADVKHFTKVAALAKKVPIPFAAKLAEHALGPVLAARVTGLIEAELASKLARRLSPAFLADLAVELDPRHADAILTHLPPELIAANAAELDRRGEHIAMSMFVAHLDDAALRRTLEVLSDEALLRVGFLLEAPERLDAIFAQLPDERISAVVALAAEEDRWDELNGIADWLGPEQRARADRLRAVLVAA